MKMFVFRNSTVEPFFLPHNAEFSDYGALAVIPDGHDVYIWFYCLPFKSDIELLAREIDDYSQKLEYLASNIPPDKMFLIFTLENIFSVSWEISDTRMKNKIIEFNKHIILVSEEKPNIKIIDLSDFLKNFGYKERVDWKYYYISQIMLNPKMAKSFHSWFESQLNAINSIRKKCIVLDLDNTLWGGIIGEDGIDGIKLGGSYPGNCFSDFQANLLEASQKGVILAICSKNNKSDILELWKKNPFLVLKKEHFAGYRINWSDKVTNLKDLAQSLNIGLDSMVFLDDNPAEREFVSQSLPEVIVPEFPSQPYMLNNFFKEIYEKYFSVYALTAEDRTKTEQYLALKERTEYKSAFSNIEDYIANLRIEIEIQETDDFNIPRIAQLTQKTNQFNLTTKRYSEDDIRSFIKQGHFVFCASVKDKFGDNGITSVIILTLDKKNKIVDIDTFCLSCRILGRGIEKAILSFALNHLFKQGYGKAIASYIPSTKNIQTSNFYDDFGFELINNIDGIKNYSITLKHFDIKNYFKLYFKTGK